MPICFSCHKQPELKIHVVELLYLFSPLLAHLCPFIRPMLTCSGILNLAT